MKYWLGILLACCALSAAAKDFLVVVSRPNLLHVIDLAARTTVHSFVIPGDGLPSAVTLPKDGKVAYVLTNRNESISGIDLDSGKEVFRADMSLPGERVKSMMAMVVSDDGKLLYVHQLPTRMTKNEYEVMPTRIAVYNTADGVGAKPVRVFPAPRRIGLLAVGASSDRLIALGWDMYVIDGASGRIDKTFPLRNWKRDGMGEPDILDFWPQYEQARMLSTPYYAPRTNVDPTSPEALQLGMLTFDLDSETMQVVEVANADTAIFSSVVNPVNKNEAFAVMNQISRIDLAAKKVVQQVKADRTHYAINISSDGKELYLGGATDIVSVYDAATLQKTAEITIPGHRDQSTSSLRVVRR
ncbi:MAG: quinohemoprotein amine dehydrogenase subunit beta [Rhodocyclaceae bacterium]|nr:quinohemoprotein amine dehydrogenase subunit beta [Rhodocyclaceae bacterium]